MYPSTNVPCKDTTLAGKENAVPQEETRRMISLHPRNLRNDNIRVCFKYINYYNLIIYKDVTKDASGSNSAKFFRDGGKILALKIQKLQII